MATRTFGGIRKLPSGRYQARYLSPLTGERVLGPMTFATKADARAWLATQEADLTRGVLRQVRPEQMVLFADYFATWIAQRGLKSSTQALYRDLHTKFLSPAFDRDQVRLITPAEVRAWYARVGETTGDARRAQAYRLLRAVLNTAVEDEILEANPCRIKHGGTVESEERPIATVAEVEKIARGVPERYYALVLLLAWSGLRFGEATALRRKDIDLQNGTVRVSQRIYRDASGTTAIDSPKTRRGRRTVHVPTHVTEALRAHLAAYPAIGDALVFRTVNGNPVARSNWSSMFRSAAAAAGRPDLRSHDLRHTGATLAAATGATLADLMARLGHSSPRAALIYQHATEEGDARIAEELSRLAGGAKAT